MNYPAKLHKLLQHHVHLGLSLQDACKYHCSLTAGIRGWDIPHIYTFSCRNSPDSIPERIPADSRFYLRRN